jgi:uncharacterized protein (TIGR01777 family)
MKILISGGTGFLGRKLAQPLVEGGDEIFILTRGFSAPQGMKPVHWDAKTTNGWGDLMNEMDVVIHLAGKSLSSWPWTSSKKQAFYDSRVLPGLALGEAIQYASHRPSIFIQQSGINHYGLDGPLADESTSAGGDFLALLTVYWEDATKSVEELGVRRIILRSAVVLGEGDGLLPLMTLPIKLYMGGPLGNGKQAMPWIHIKDWVGAIRYLIANENAQGSYNLIAPTPISNDEFNRTLAHVLHRPYWFPAPAFMIRTLFGEMSVLILEGRFAQPKRLIDSGFHFQFSELRDAFMDLAGK